MWIEYIHKFSYMYDCMLYIWLQLWIWCVYMYMRIRKAKWNSTMQYCTRDFAQQHKCKCVLEPFGSSMFLASLRPVQDMLRMFDWLDVNQQVGFFHSAQTNLSQAAFSFLWGSLCYYHSPIHFMGPFFSCPGKHQPRRLHGWLRLVVTTWSA